MNEAVEDGEENSDEDEIKPEESEVGKGLFDGW